MSISVLRGALLAALALSLLPGAGEAQSMLSSQGLGYVLEPADARGRALGGMLMGLPGTSLMPANPAEALTTPFISASVAFHQDHLTAQWRGSETSTEVARFPYVYATFPLGARAAVSLAFTTLLDQNWSAVTEDTLTLGGEPVPVVDHFVSTGGVSQLRLGGAYRLGESLLAGASLNLHTGSNERTQLREFPPAGHHLNHLATSRWLYSGVSGTAGARWSPHEAAVISASMTLGGTLRGAPTDTLQESRSYALPWEAAGGASVRVTPSVVLAAGGNYRAWSELDPALAEVGGARDAWSFGGGVELDAAPATQRSVPLRLGARTAALPFRLRGEAGAEEWLHETALTAGAGLRMAAGLARIDAGIERGTRGGSGAGLEESFWRFSLSAVISGR
jgi:hypothetical protein